MQLRVATLNVWGMPPPLGRQVRYRMGRIGEEVARLELDVIAFQEVWTAVGRRRLVRAARDAGLEHIWSNPEEPGGGGLIVASRLPLRAVRFSQFALPQAATRVDELAYYAGKGFVEARVETPAGPLRLVNTHLHSQSRTYRVAQIVELAGHLLEAEEPTIALGDFNFRPPNPEYAIWSGLTGMRDAAVLTGEPEPTVFPGNPMRARHRARRIDYLFLRDGARQGIRPIHTERVFDRFFDRNGRSVAFSDHAGVLTTLELNEPQTSTAWRPDREAAQLARHLLAEGRAEAESRQETDRMVAGIGWLAALGAAAGLRDDRITRRRLLRRTLQLAGIVAIPPAAACAVFSTLTNPDELAIYDRLASRLDRFARETDGGLA